MDEVRGSRSRHDGGRTLVLGCSAAKRAVQAPTKACDLYDGPSFRVFRRYVSSQQSNVRLLILSGKYGLIEGDRLIEAYDSLLSFADDAPKGELTNQVLNLVKATSSNSTVAVMSGRYFNHLRGAWDDAGVATQLRLVAGSPGVRLSALKRWLYGTSRGQLALACRPSITTLCGQPIILDLTIAERIVQRAIDEGEFARLRLSAWSVDVGGRNVPPKWLVAKATSTRPSDFHTHKALCVLGQLGFTLREVAE